MSLSSPWPACWWQKGVSSASFASFPSLPLWPAMRGGFPQHPHAFLWVAPPGG